MNTSSPLYIPGARKSYKRYINSKEWKEKSRLLKKNKKCFICNSTENLNLHHLTYKRLGIEIIQDFQILCKKCHEIVHFNYFGQKIMDKPRLKRRAKQMRRNWLAGKGYGLVSRKGTAHPLILQSISGNVESAPS